MESMNTLSIRRLKKLLMEALAVQKEDYVEGKPIHVNVVLVRPDLKGFQNIKRKSEKENKGNPFLLKGDLGRTD